MFNIKIIFFWTWARAQQGWHAEDCLSPHLLLCGRCPYLLSRDLLPSHPVPAASLLLTDSLLQLLLTWIHNLNGRFCVFCNLKEIYSILRTQITLVALFLNESTFRQVCNWGPEPEALRCHPQPLRCVLLRTKGEALQRQEVVRIRHKS